MIISVILAVLNGEKYLDRSIKSFLEQDYQDKELIIIDGKSTDNSHSIIENYQKPSTGKRFEEGYFLTKVVILPFL